MIKIFAVASMVVAALCLKAAASSESHGSNFYTSRTTGRTSGMAYSHEASNFERILYGLTGLVFFSAGVYLYMQGSRPQK